MAGPVRTHIRHISLKKWFPPGNPVASTIARLCVLREDLYLELQGITEKPMPSLDEHSTDYRQIYFFRNSARTLLEIRSAIEMLNTKKSFMASLKRMPPQLKEAVDELQKALPRSHVLIRKLRNEVSGHLSHTAFYEALDKIDSDTKTLVQVGNKAKEIHYKFALEFILATILRDVDKKDLKQEWNKMIKTTADLSFRAIKAIDMLFMAYARVYGHKE